MTPLVAEISTVRREPRARVLDYVRVHHALVGYAPTMQELQRALGLSLNCVYRHLHSLADEGQLRRLPGQRGFLPVRELRIGKGAA